LTYIKKIDNDEKHNVAEGEKLKKGF